MAVTSRQIAVVRATLIHLTARPEQATMAFRMGLCRYAPALNPALEGGPVAMLTDAIAAIDRPSELQKCLSGVAYDLRAAGMSPRGYMALHAALLDMACAQLGGNSELEEAWGGVIGVILATMLAMAHGPRSHVMPLAA